MVDTKKNTRKKRTTTKTTKSDMSVVDAFVNENIGKIIDNELNAVSSTEIVDNIVLPEEPVKHNVENKDDGIVNQIDTVEINDNIDEAIVELHDTIIEEPNNEEAITNDILLDDISEVSSTKTTDNGHIQNKKTIPIRIVTTHMGRCLD